MTSSERENEDYGLGYQNTLVSILFRSLSMQDFSDIKSDLLRRTRANPWIHVQRERNEVGAYAKPLLRSRVEETLFVKLKSRALRTSQRGICNANFEKMRGLD